MDCIALQCLLRFEQAVEHKIRIGGVQPSVDDHLDVNQAGNLTFQGFQAGFDFFLDSAFLSLAELAFEFPEYDVSYHSLFFFILPPINCFIALRVPSNCLSSLLTS